MQWKNISNKGWFQNTIKEKEYFGTVTLRLDGDWYESTKPLEELYDSLNKKASSLLMTILSVMVQKVVDEFRQKRKIYSQINLDGKEEFGFQT